jgi:hypothetical protein
LDPISGAVDAACGVTKPSHNILNQSKLDSSSQEFYTANLELELFKTTPLRPADIGDGAS